MFEFKSIYRLATPSCKYLLATVTTVATFSIVRLWTYTPQEFNGTKEEEEEEVLRKLGNSDLRAEQMVIPALPNNYKFCSISCFKCQETIYWKQNMDKKIEPHSRQVYIGSTVYQQLDITQKLLLFSMLTVGSFQLFSFHCIVPIVIVNCILVALQDSMNEIKRIFKKKLKWHFNYGLIFFPYKLCFSE